MCRTHIPATGMDILRIQRIAQAQAWQRTGRAGRQAAGFCYRSYTLQVNPVQTFSVKVVLTPKYNPMIT